MIPLRFLTLALASIGAAVGSYALLRRKPKTPEEIEHERRSWLGQVGRITDGTVIDVQELTPSGRTSTMLI